MAVVISVTALNAGWFDLVERSWSLERRTSLGPPPSADASSAVPTRTSDAPAAIDDREPAAAIHDSRAINEGRPAVAQGPRFAVEFGPFASDADAARTERQINQAGHPTVRFRQQTGAALYAVLIEQVASARAAQEVVAALRDQAFPDPVILSDGDTLSIRIGEPMLLRAAVQLGTSLRAKNYQVRVASQAGEAQTFVIRHGNFASHAEAQGRSAELERSGLPNHIVRSQ